MIRFTWLQFRTQAAVASCGLAIVAAVLAVTGPSLVHAYDTGAAICRAHGDCPAVTAAFLLKDHGLRGWLGVLVVVVPGIIGIFWGAPLVAREFETGTYRLSWTQGVARTHWMAIKLGVIGLASLIVAGLLSFMVTWWSSPLDRVSMDPFQSFDRRDIVPIGYAAFAFALGVTAGLLIRRTLPAMATTLAVFAGARLAVTNWVRPRLIAPLRITTPDYAIAGTGNGPVSSGRPGDWVLSDKIINAGGHVIGQNGTIGNGDMSIGFGPHGVSIQGVGACPGITPPKIRLASPNHAAFNAAVQKCVGQLRVRDVLTYQPASRYWSFQWYELAIFLGAALILGGFCLWWSRRRRSEERRVHPHASRAPALESSA